MTARTPYIFHGAALRVALAAMAIAVTLLAGFGASGRAAAATGPVEAVFGSVVAVAVPNSITVATDNGVIRLQFDSETALTGQGIDSMDDVAEGDRVVATAFRQEDGTLIAGRVLIQPVLSKPVTKHIVGVVVEAESGEIIVQDRDGNVVTIGVTSGIELPSVGEVVTLVASLDRSTGRLEARAFQRVEDTIRRFEDAVDSTGNAAERERLAAAAEEARAKHLSILEQSRAGLEQARAALAAAQGDVSRAETRLLEVEAQYERLRRQYEQLAEENNRPSPNLRVNGILTYRPDQWSLQEGTFLLTQRGVRSDESGGIEFRFEPGVQVTFTVVDSLTAAGITAGMAYRYTEPARLADVKALIESGASAIVVYNPDQRPLTAQQIIILPPELDRDTVGALEEQRLRSFQGVITLVEREVDIDGAAGVVIVASDARGEKVATIVMADTAITVDGTPASISDLAAGHVVVVVFKQDGNEDESSTSALRGRIGAASIDARTTNADQDEIGVVGSIRMLDLATRTILIVTRDGSIRATVPNGARISLNGAAARFDQLSVGDLVLDGTRYNRRTGEITSLVAVSPREQAVRGTIVGLSVEPPRVVVATGGGDVLTLVITDRTELVTENGRPLLLRELSVGQLVVKGSYEIAQRDSASYLVATSLVIAEPQVIVATGLVQEVDLTNQLLVMSVTRATSGSTESLRLVANERSVISKNGVQLRSLESITAGDIVNSVAYSPSTNLIVKLAVSSPNLVQVRGTVARVGELNDFLVISSEGRDLRLSVSSSTRLTLNGRPIDSLRGVEVGDNVNEAIYIANASDRSTGDALSISIMSRQSPQISGDSRSSTGAVETTITGVIDGYERGQWLSISGRRLIITSDTRFDGAEPQVGLVARAALRLGADGAFTVAFISVAGNPADEPTTRPGDTTGTRDTGSSTTDSLVRFQGEITLLTDDTIVIQGTRVVTTRETRVSGTLRSGAIATVVAQRDASGLVVAVEIIVH